MALGEGGGGGSSKGVRAGAAYVELNGKDNLSGFLDKMKAKIARAMQIMAGAAVVGIGAAIGGLNVFASTADDLTKMRDAIKAMGMSATGGSGLLGVLNQFSDLGENVEGLTQFSQKVEDALKGVGGAGGEAAKLFDGLGVSANDLIDLPLDEKFLKVHEAIRELPQAQQQFKLSMLGGTDSMKKWLPLLSMSNAELREQAKNLAFGAAEMEEAAEASKAMRTAGAAVNRVWQQTVIMLAPAVRDMANGLTEAMKPVVEWMKGRTLTHLWDEGVARFNLGFEEVKQYGLETWLSISGRAEDMWYDVEATAKVAFIELTHWLQDLFSGPNIWSGLTVGLAVQMNAVGKLFNSAMTGMAVQAVNKLGKVGEAMANPLKAAGIAAILMAAPGAAPLLAGDEIKKAMDGANAEMKRQMEEQARAAKETLEKGKGGALQEAEDKKAEAAARRELQLLKGKAGVDARRVELNATLARIEEERKRRRGNDWRDIEINFGPRGDDMMAKIGRAMGTFGAGSFLTQGYGVQSADNPVKKMVDEQKKTVAKLGDVVDAIKRIDVIPKIR